VIAGVRWFQEVDAEKADPSLGLEMTWGWGVLMVSGSEGIDTSRHGTQECVRHAGGLPELACYHELA
jgi:hypothetical protein